MSTATPKARRSNGTGTLHVQTRADGRQLWYGRWYAGSRRLNRRIGLKRKRGTGRGLTKIEAEAELRRMMLSDRPPVVGDEISFATAAELMLRELEEIGRKPTTLDIYRQILRVRLLPRFGDISVDRVKRSQVESAGDPDAAGRKGGADAIEHAEAAFAGLQLRPAPALVSRESGDAEVAQRRTLDTARGPGRRRTASVRQRSRFRADMDLVFASPITGEPLDNAALLRRFRVALKAAGVRRVRFHDLRHTFGTRMAASPEASMRKIQEWMGHRDYRTTLIYADYEPR